MAMATTMSHAGMTQLLAETLSKFSGPLFPFISPFIGALGGIHDGQQYQQQCGILAAYKRQRPYPHPLCAPHIGGATAGAAIGSSFAPAKVVVGCSTVPGANDGKTLRLTTLYGLGVITVIGLVAWLLT
ncbi:MAG: L-lactate permease [Chloroflexi bacterium]|nr:L-lactate permease [Chloroflexota bacterium]